MKKFIIHSTIESYTEGVPMKKSLKKRDESPVIKSESTGELVETMISPDDEKYQDYHKSEAKSSDMGFFHRVERNHNGISQVTNVNVNIGQANEDDPVSGCFKSIFKCLK